MPRCAAAFSDRGGRQLPASCRRGKHTDDGALALVIVLDQFPRNMFRDDTRIYSSDALAREVAGRAIARGADVRIEPALLEFLYMPLMHSEDLADQLRCIELFRARHPDKLKYAEVHADIIRRFGRFPHRNRMLGRATTPQEQAFLDGADFPANDGTVNEERPLPFPRLPEYCAARRPGLRHIRTFREN